MSSETEIRSFRVDMPDEAIADLRQRIADTRWPTREFVADRSQGVQLATLAELARYWGGRVRLARVRGEAERADAGQDRDRRAGYPLHPREVTARGRVAADHHARLARLDHRDPRGHRSAHRPDGTRRLRRGRVRPGDTPTSPTSTRSTRAATSPPGKSPSCSRPRSGRRSSRCANHSPHWSCGSAHLARLHVSLRRGSHDTYWRNSHAYHESPPSSSRRPGRRPRGGCRQRRRDHRPERRGG